MLSLKSYGSILTLSVIEFLELMLKMQGIHGGTVFFSLLFTSCPPLDKLSIRNHQHSSYSLVVLENAEFLTTGRGVDICLVDNVVPGLASRQLELLGRDIGTQLHNPVPPDGS